MSKIICICSTARDIRELQKLPAREHEFIFHDYASLELEDLTANEPPDGISIADPETQICALLDICAKENVDAAISTDDYPGSTLAAVVAEKMKFPGTTAKANLVCQHKFYSRQVQAAAVPEAVPDFHLIDVRATALPSDVLFPLFIKPVKSFFSVGAQRVENQDELAEIKARWAKLPAFFAPFEILFRKCTGISMGTNWLIAEGLLEGSQATLDGYVYDGQVHRMGVVDSIMFPGTISFQRFEYPSSLPEQVQQRMFDIAKKTMSALGFDHGPFNIEFIYNPGNDTIHIVEINPRTSSQFADLFEKVDGTNSYSVLLDLALGREPQIKRRAGKFGAASSCVLRTFQNQKVIALPSSDETEKLQREFPEMRIEILAAEGLKLSQQMQDNASYRYGLINIGGRDRDEILEIFDECKRKLTFVFEAA